MPVKPLFYHLLLTSRLLFALTGCNKNFILYGEKMVSVSVPFLLYPKKRMGFANDKWGS